MRFQWIISEMLCSSIQANFRALFCFSLQLISRTTSLQQITVHIIRSGFYCVHLFRILRIVITFLANLRFTLGFHVLHRMFVQYKQRTCSSATADRWYSRNISRHVHCTYREWFCSRMVCAIWFHFGVFFWIWLCILHAFMPKSAFHAFAETVLIIECKSARYVLKSVGSLQTYKCFFIFPCLAFLTFILRGKCFEFFFAYNL